MLLRWCLVFAVGLWGCCSFDLRLFGLCYGLFVLVVGLVVGALM